MSDFFVKRDKVKLGKKVVDNKDSTVTITDEKPTQTKKEKIKLIGKTTEKVIVKKEDKFDKIYSDILTNSYFVNKDKYEVIEDDGNKQKNNQVLPIETVEFTLLPNEEVKRISVCEVTNTKWEGENSLYDRKMGIQDKNNTCDTCGEQWKVCPGHFGHIELAQPIPHPIQTKLILKYLQVFCKNCYNLIIDKERESLLNFTKLKKEAKLNAIYEESEKIFVCPHCSNAIPKYFNNEDSYFMKFSKTEQKPYKLSYVDIHNIFTNIDEKQFKLCGYDDPRLHPRNLIISNLLVLPPCTRPYVLNGDQSCHDDLTYKYIDIIKVNNKIKETGFETTRNSLVDALYFHIKTLFDNSKGKSRESSNKRPIKCIKSRLKGKTGQIRNNLQGKRCDFNGRSVITAEVNCMADEIVLPTEFAKKLTYPVTVNALNIEECKTLLANDKIVGIKRGDKKFETDFACFTRGFKVQEDDEIIRDGKTTTVWLYEHTKDKKFELQEGDIVVRDGVYHQNIVPPKRKNFELKIGDVVERHMKDGDLVVLNRQPTLWKGSMRAKKVKIRPGKTIRFALSSTQAYNADRSY